MLKSTSGLSNWKNGFYLVIIYLVCLIDVTRSIVQWFKIVVMPRVILYHADTSYYSYFPIVCDRKCMYLVVHKKESFPVFSS